MASMRKEGPWGGQGNTPFDMGSVIGNRLTKIKIQYDEEWIRRFTVEDIHKGAVRSNEFGGITPRGTEREIVLQKDEYLYSIEGTYRGYRLHTMSSLTFITNQQVFQCGTPKGTFFGIPRDKNNMILGFHGTTQGILASIGVYIYADPLNACLLASMTKEGPWGSQGDTPFDMGSVIGSRLTKIKIRYDKDWIKKVTVEDIHKGAVRSNEFGSRFQGGTEREIDLQKDEYLYSIEGTYCGGYGAQTMSSLTLITNQQVFQCGIPKGISFGIPRDKNNKIIGFHGTTRDLLTSIGVYIYAGPLNDCLQEPENLEKTNALLKQEIDVLKAGIVELEKLGNTNAELKEENDALKAELAEQGQRCKNPIRIISKVDASYSLAARNHGVIFVPSNPGDKYQRWSKYISDDTNLKDTEGFSCFAIVNQATGQAIQYTGKVKPVGLVPYNPDRVDASILWTESRDVGDGFHYVRSLENINRIWDAFNVSTQLQDGIVLGVFDRITGSNQLWKTEPWA